MSRQARATQLQPDGASVQAASERTQVGASGQESPSLRNEWERLFGVPAPRSTAADSFVAQAVAWQRQVLAHGNVPRQIQHDLQLAAEGVAAKRGKLAAGATAQTSGASCAGPEAEDAATGAPRATASRRQGSGASRASLAPAADPLPPASSQLLIGTRLVKLHGGKPHVVEVTPDGMLYEGALFGSLSAVARHITGTHWNGLLFFGLRRRRVYPKAKHG